MDFIVSDVCLGDEYAQALTQGEGGDLRGWPVWAGSMSKFGLLSSQDRPTLCNSKHA